MQPVIRVTEAGLYCAAGDFYIDPWRKVARAVTTHAHSDHARPGCGAYLCPEEGRAVLAARVGAKAVIDTLPYGERKRLGAAVVSLHPAGHILGSAQVRVETDAGVWVVSGDYNNSTSTPACTTFEAVRCDVFITESTFGLPIYRWPDPGAVFAEIHDWWAANRAAGITSILPAYPLGKSQRLLAGLDAAEGPIAVHGNVKTFLPIYEAAGIRLAPTVPLTEKTAPEIRGKGLVITSSAAHETGIIRKLGPVSHAFASGWMQTRAARRSRDGDRGFVMSDHADWPGLLAAVEATGACRIGVTHGELESFSRYLRERSYDAFPVPTRFTGEGTDAETETGK
ncbi:MAG: ligase-associated DNA damage response exonuclease [Opitutales bacterium]|nr:ligase-associated DNA damage response exonuclease [Opitutales bacterium]